ncbi:MAG: M48 family metalloprotease [Aeromonas sp.]
MANQQKDERVTRDHNDASAAQLKLLSNAKFLRWFLLLNIGLVVGLVWTGPGALVIPFLGFAGALFSLVFCKWLAKRAHGVKVIDSRNPGSNQEKQLYEMVAELATRAGLPAVPEVGIYDSPDINAFATGSTPSNALIAFSSSLLDRMDRQHIQAVAAHEIGHIANKDMLGVVLLQGIINSIVLLATLPINLMRVMNIFGDNFSWFIEFTLWLVKTIAAILLTLLGGLVVKAFSRSREYRADAYAAVLLGKEPMMNALKVLDNDTTKIPLEQHGYAAFKISGRCGFSEFFSTHPPIGKRLIALDDGVYIPMVDKSAGATVNKSAEPKVSTQTLSDEGVPHRGKRKYIMALLMFFGGWCGLHKFYAGNWGWGLIYLMGCFTWFPTILSFIELVRLLCLSKDGFDLRYNYQKMTAFRMIL